VVVSQAGVLEGEGVVSQAELLEGEVVVSQAELLEGEGVELEGVVARVVAGLGVEAWRVWLETFVNEMVMIF
jgi:hypothetical protein